MAVGIAPTALVACGGACLGAIVWHAYVRDTDFSAFLTLVALAAGGIVVAMIAWLGVCSYAAKRGEVDLVVLLRIGSLPFGCLLAYPLISALPFSGDRPSIGAGTSIALFGVGVVAAFARYETGVRAALFAFFVTRIPIVAVAELSSRLVPLSPGKHVSVSQDPWLAVWGRWDAVHYLDIARVGYHGTDYAFFPLYPATIRIVGTLIGDDLIAALLISNVAFFVALVLLFRLVVSLCSDEQSARRAVLYLAAFPTSLFFSAAYNESLFLAFTIGSFYCMQRRRWLSAGCLGGFAALTRSEGVLMIVPYVMEVLAPERGYWHAIKTSLAVRRHLTIGAMFIPLGLVAYMILTILLTGDPFSFATVQSHWNRHPAAPWVGISRSIQMIRFGGGATVAVQSIELVATLAILATLIVGARYLRYSYVAYAFLAIAIPISTSSLMSTPRFALAIFPLFMILAIWGERRPVHEALLFGFLPLLGLFTVLYANWYWVA